MFDKSEILPILFNFKIENEYFICRFDCDLFSDKKDEEKILILELIGLHDINEAQKELSKGIGNVVEYSIYQGKENNKIEFIIDYGMCEYETSFIQYSEKYVKYDDIDLMTKIKILKKWYLNYYKSYHNIYAKHQNLLGIIKKYYIKESEILNRKLKFYLEQNSHKAGYIRSQISELDKFLKVILSNNTE